MPKITGSPITISNGQPQREVTHFNVTVSYYAAGVPSFTFNAFSRNRLRAADGSVLYESDQTQFLTLPDVSLPANVKTALIAVVNKLDTI
jgi:hypothetical protein